MAKFNHMFDVAFAFDSDNDWDEVKADELLRALKKRVDMLELEFLKGDDSIEAFGHLETITEGEE